MYIQILLVVKCYIFASSGGMCVYIFNAGKSLKRAKGALPQWKEASMSDYESL